MGSNNKPQLYKFHLLGSAGGATPTAESLFYNWAVIHTTLMLGTRAPVANFLRYAQSYCNPDVPNDTRILPRHPTIRYLTLADHWAHRFENLEKAISDESHEERMGRHDFGDTKAVKFFAGKGGEIWKADGFAHPAALTVAHWVVVDAGVGSGNLNQALKGHQEIMVQALKVFGKKVKYTVDVCGLGVEKEIETSVLKNLPVTEYKVVEWLHWANTADGLSFGEIHGADLRRSYAGWADMDKSHSLYGVERVVLDFTDDNPSTKTPLPRYFTDKDSAEYKVMHNDWKAPYRSFEILDGTKWASYQTNTGREPTPKEKIFSAERFQDKS